MILHLLIRVQIGEITTLRVRCFYLGNSIREFLIQRENKPERGICFFLIIWYRVINLTFDARGDSGLLDNPDLQLFVDVAYCVVQGKKRPDDFSSSCTRCSEHFVVQWMRTWPQRRHSFCLNFTHLEEDVQIVSSHPPLSLVLFCACPFLACQMTLVKLYDKRKK